MASTIAMAGRMKHAPPTSSPAQPARRRLSTIASCVELGPGSTLTAPNRSRNSASSSQRRRRTVSSRSMATCTAGPPKAIVPSLSITTATSPSRRGGRRVAALASSGSGSGSGVSMVSDRQGCWRPVRQGRYPARRRCPRTAAGSSPGGLEQFDGVAGGVLQQDLRAARPGDDVVAELQAGGTEPVDLRGQVTDLQVEAVPAAGDGSGAVGHGPPARAGRAAEQQPHAVTADGGKRQGGVLLQGEAEVGGVERDGVGDVVDHVADADRGGGLGHAHLRGVALGVHYETRYRHTICYAHEVVSAWGGAAARAPPRRRAPRPRCLDGG